jgi:anhydro-N-acetylmuramic acid kinase
MVYKVIGLMSGSSLDGLDIVFVDLEESGGVWKYDILQADCIGYNEILKAKLSNAIFLPTYEYLQLHVEYGQWLGKTVNDFINKHNLQHQVHFIASHGHTTFHDPAKKITHQLGDGAGIASATKLPVISDLRSLDVALAGQGAPIVPIGELLLFPETQYFLNLGGIANLSFRELNTVKAFDVCPANRVLNLITETIGKAFDKDGQLASTGISSEKLLNKLNHFEYYELPAPKSLSNTFGTETLYPLIITEGISVADSLATFIDHITGQVKSAFLSHKLPPGKLMVTGGGAHNKFLMQRLTIELSSIGIEVYLPSAEVIDYKEALIMALFGTLRWREQNNTLKDVTGATRNSIGGAMWLGAEG